MTNIDLPSIKFQNFLRNADNKALWTKAPTLFPKLSHKEAFSKVVALRVLALNLDPETWENWIGNKTFVMASIQRFDLDLIISAFPHSTVVIS